MGNLYKEYTPPAPKGRFHKFEDGIKFRFRIMSEPVVFQNNYQGQVSTKYAWVMWNVEDDIAQIVQLPVTGYRAIAAICADSDYGDPLEKEYDLKITRDKINGKTSYSVLAGTAATHPSEETKEAIADIDLLEAIEGGIGVENAMWLRDAMGGTPAAERGAAKAKAHVPDDDIGDEPINLDDIPF